MVAAMSGDGPAAGSMPRASPSPSSATTTTGTTTTNLAKEYLTGSLAASFTAALFNPLEVVKVRLQLQDMRGWTRIYNHGFARALYRIAKEDGVARLWSYGLAPVVARDFVYSGARTGMYPAVRTAVSAGRPAEETLLVQKILAGALCGGVGSAIANPFDVVRVRMIAEGGVMDPATRRLATGMRRGETPRWTSSLACAACAARTDGYVRGLMLRGIAPSVSRAALLTAAQLSTYDHTKVTAKRHGVLAEGPALYFVAAGVSGFAAQLACNPADVLKSRIMSAAKSAPAAATTTVAGMARTIVREEGVRGFYRGFFPGYARVGPTIFLQMPLVEALRAALGVRAL